MKLRLIDREKNLEQQDCYVKRLPKEKEFIFLADGKCAEISKIVQFGKTNIRGKEPDYVASVLYTENMVKIKSLGNKRG